MKRSAGEGTNIEPSREFGYRDLEIVQNFRRTYIDKEFKPQPDDLRLPLKLLQQRRDAHSLEHTRQLDGVSKLLSSGRFTEARSTLDSIDGRIN